MGARFGTGACGKLDEACGEVDGACGNLVDASCDRAAAPHNASPHTNRADGHAFALLEKPVGTFMLSY